MNAQPVSCSKCKTPLASNLFNLPELTPCPYCGQLLQIEIFPAMFQRFTPGKTGEAVMEETESSCFYHPQKKAVLPCDACGKFLCALCDCELDGQHICPSCLETGKRKGKIKSLENHRVLYDGMALAFAVGSFIPPIIYVSFATGPAAIYLAIRHWNTPTSITHRTKARYWAAIAIGLLVSAGWVFLIYALSVGFFKRP